MLQIKGERDHSSFILAKYVFANSDAVRTLPLNKVVVTDLLNFQFTTFMSRFCWRNGFGCSRINSRCFAGEKHFQYNCKL